MSTNSPPVPAPRSRLGPARRAASISSYVLLDRLQLSLSDQTVHDAGRQALWTGSLDERMSPLRRPVGRRRVRGLGIRRAELDALHGCERLRLGGLRRVERARADVAVR